MNNTKMYSTKIRHFLAQTNHTVVLYFVLLTQYARTYNSHEWIIQKL